MCIFLASFDQDDTSHLGLVFLVFFFFFFFFLAALNKTLVGWFGFGERKKIYLGSEKKKIFFFSPASEGGGGGYY